MSNFFKHDGSAAGTLLSEHCHGKCVAYDKQEDVTLLGNCTEEGSLQWKVL